MKKLLLGSLLALAIMIPTSWAAQVNARYRVQPGDTLRTIAERLLGDPDRWEEIYALNAKTIGDDPNDLKRDTILLIPIPEERLQGIIGRPLENGEKPPAQPTPQPPGKTYTVKPGDGLMGIARRELKNPALWREIYRSNREKIGKNPNRIQVGMIFSLPVAQASITPVAPNEYVVQTGDTLYKIARKVFGNQERWRDIYRLNRERIGRNPHRLKAGMRLSLPPKQ